MITILFGTKNKQDDEDQEQVDDRSEDGQKPSPSEHEEIEEAASIPFSDSRPPRDPKVSEKYRTSHSETSLPTSSSRNYFRHEEEELPFSIYRYLSNAGSCRNISCPHV